MKNFKIYKFFLIMLLSCIPLAAFGMEESEDLKEEREEKPKIIRKMESLQNITLGILHECDIDLFQKDKKKYRQWLKDLPKHVVKLLKSRYPSNPIV